jgi:Carboxylesterase family
LSLSQRLRPSGCKGSPSICVDSWRWIRRGHVNQFPISIIQKSKGQIVGVEIQYRLGAFGFLASEDVKQHGTLNPGLLDQQFALQWVQKYIHCLVAMPHKLPLEANLLGLDQLFCMLSILARMKARLSFPTSLLHLHICHTCTGTTTLFPLIGIAYSWRLLDAVNKSECFGNF